MSITIYVLNYIGLSWLQKIYGWCVSGGDSEENINIEITIVNSCMVFIIFQTFFKYFPERNVYHSSNAATR